MSPFELMRKDVEGNADIGCTAVDDKVKSDGSVYRNWHDVGAIFSPQWNKYRRTLYLHLWNGNAPLVAANNYVFVRNFGRAARIATCGLCQNRTITNGGTVLMKVDNPVPVGHRNTSNIITAGHSTSKPGRLIAVQQTTSGSRNELAITEIQPGHFDVHFSKFRRPANNHLVRVLAYWQLKLWAKHGFAIPTQATPSASA